MESKNPWQWYGFVRKRSNRRIQKRKYERRDCKSMLKGECYLYVVLIFVSLVSPSCNKNDLSTNFFSLGDRILRNIPFLMSGERNVI